MIKGRAKKDSPPASVDTVKRRIVISALVVGFAAVVIAMSPIGGVAGGVGAAVTLYVIAGLGFWIVWTRRPRLEGTTLRSFFRHVDLDHVETVQARRRAMALSDGTRRVVVPARLGQTDAAATAAPAIDAADSDAFGEHRRAHLVVAVSDAIAYVPLDQETADTLQRTATRIDPYGRIPRFDPVVISIWIVMIPALAAAIAVAILLS